MIQNKAISAFGTRYVHELVLDLLRKAFQSYERREHSKKWFTVSGRENILSTAGILLAVVTVEACRNRIFYSAKKRISWRSPADDLSKFLLDKGPQATNVNNIFKEVFTIRDVIVHNHLYVITFYQTDDWEFVRHRQRLLKGYGRDKKFKDLVNTRTKKTKFLGLNAQPLKIGFEDLWLVLTVFDLFLRLATAKVGYSPVFKSTYKFEGNWQQEKGLSRLLGWYYDKTMAANPKAGKRLKKTLISICNLLGDPELYKDTFLSNRCPKCDEFAFRKPNKIYNCGECGYEIKSPTAAFIGLSRAGAE